MGKLYFRQLLAGADFGREAPMAANMQNYVYLIGDRDSGEALVVDPAWAVAELVELAAKDGMRVTCALATHYHPDHVGGDLFGRPVDGLATLMEVAPCPVHVHRLEAHGVRVVTGLSENDLVRHDSGDRVKVGEVEVELLHTPGHTPGSLCFRLQDKLIAGDTLFLQGCGRVDLPGGNAEDLFHSLHDRLGSLPGDTVVFPGHAYSGASAPIGTLRERNTCLRVRDLPTWMQMMGAG